MDTYTQNGVTYCCQCNEPIIAPRHVLGRTIRPRCKCRCEREAAEMAAKREQVAAHLELVDNLRAEALPQGMWGWTFNNDGGYNSVNMARARYFVERWHTAERPNGYLFLGPTGTGKTYLAACIANALVEMEVPVLLVSTQELIERTKSLFSEDRELLLNSLQKYQLLIIDDLGAEVNKEYWQSQLYCIIDKWYVSGKPMIVTTNLHLSQMQAVDLVRRRIYDRILERCVPFGVEEVNIRQLIADHTKKEVRNREGRYHNE